MMDVKVLKENQLTNTLTFKTIDLRFKSLVTLSNKVNSNVEKVEIITKKNTFNSERIYNLELAVRDYPVIITGLKDDVSYLAHLITSNKKDDKNSAG